MSQLDDERYIIARDGEYIKDPDTMEVEKLSWKEMMTIVLEHGSKVGDTLHITRVK